MFARLFGWLGRLGSLVCLFDCLGGWEVGEGWEGGLFVCLFGQLVAWVVGKVSSVVRLGRLVVCLFVCLVEWLVVWVVGKAGKVVWLFV